MVGNGLLCCDQLWCYFEKLRGLIERRRPATSFARGVVVCRRWKLGGGQRWRLEIGDFGMRIQMMRGDAVAYPLA